MDTFLIYAFDIASALVGAALITFIILFMFRKFFKSSVRRFYHWLAVILSFALLIASAGFNVAFTYSFLNPIVFASVAVLLAAIMGGVNIGAFFVDISLAESIKKKQKVNILAFGIVRISLVIYSILSASTVFNSGQLHIKKMEGDLQLYSEYLEAQNQIAESEAITKSLSALPDTPLTNLKGHEVSMSNCKPNGHSHYLKQQVCKDYLAASTSGKDEYLKVKSENTLKQLEESKKIPVAMTPVMGVSNNFIFMLIAFLLEGVAFALVMFTKFYNGNDHSPTPLPVQITPVPPTVQPKIAKKSGLLGVSESARKTLDRNRDVTDSDVTDLIIDLWHNNKNERLSVNKLNSIINDEVGYRINKNRLIEIMTDTNYIVDKLEDGKKAYFLAGDRIEDKRYISNVQSSKDDSGNKRAESLRSGLSKDV